MLNNVNTNVERIIAKIDNDFNPDQSDWIPRVGAWAIDAMTQIDALPKVRKKIKLIVHDRIAYSDCPIDSPNLIVYDNNGCKISKQKSSSDCECDSSTGEISKAYDVTPKTVDAIYNRGATNGPNMKANVINNANSHRYNYEYQERAEPREYVLVGDNKLELSFDANCVYVETDVVVTTFSETYQCEIPLIPNSGILIEYIAYYCIYKMLCRGYKHPVFNLAASQYGTNPYYEYKQLQPIAKRDVIIDAQGNININDGNLWRSSLFISTFG